MDHPGSSEILSLSPSPGAGIAMRSAPPPRIPGHTLHRCIGRGSYGEVWLAQNVVGEWRAVKIVRRDKFNEERPYEREFEGLCHYAPVSLSHPSLLRVMQVERDEAARYFYCVMELADDAASAPAATTPTPVRLVNHPGAPASRRRAAAKQLAGETPALPGSGARIVAGAGLQPERYQPKTLREVLRGRSRLPQTECLSIGLELATALEVLHSRGLVHRDVKPSNIVFIRGEAKLADIGLVAKHENSLSLVGAEGYMPPLGGATPQADLFALGKVLYEMSTGLDRLKCPRLPALATLPARERRGILELNRVVLKACHQSPKNRYATAATLKVDLLLLQEGSSLRLRRQLKLALVTLAALVVVLGVALVFQRTWLWARAQEAAAGHVRHIYEAIVERQGLRKSGWFIKNWNHLEQAAKLRWSDDLAEHAGAVMAGEDARLIAAIKGIGGSSLVFDDQGRLFVGGLPDGQAWRWSKQKPAGPTHFTVSGDGPVIIGADGNPLQFTLQSPDRLILRELSTGLIRQEFQLPVDTVVGGRGNPNLVIAADGSRVAAAIQLPDGTPQFAVWDAASGALLAHRAEDVTDLAFSADGVHLARGHRDGVVSISRVSQMDRGTNFVAGRGAVRCLAFAPVPLESDHAFAPPEKRWLVAVSVGGGTISIHESDTGQVRSVCRGSHYDVFAVAFHPNGRVLASGGRGPLHLWDVDSGRALLSIEEDGYPVDFPRDLAFSRDGRYLTVVTKKAFAGPLLAVWEIQNGHGIDTLRGLSAQAGRVWWSADGTKLAALAHNWELGVWDVPTGRLLRIFDQQDGRSADNAAAAFSPDGRQMAFASGESARLYDLGSGAVLAERRLPLGYADQLRFLDEAHLLLLRRERGPGQRSEITWRVRNILLPGANWSQPIYEQQDTNWFAYNTASAPNSDYFAIVGRTAGTNLNGIYRVIDWRDGRQVMEVPTPLRMELCIPALAPNGRFLTHPIGPDNKSRLLRLPGGEPMGEVDTPWAISPAGDSFASPANNRACLLFGRRGAAYALKLGMDSRMVLGAEFSPDGSRLAWGTRDGTVLVAYLEKVKTRVQKLRERQ